MTEGDLRRVAEEALRLADAPRKGLDYYNRMAEHGEALARGYLAMLAELAESQRCLELRTKALKLYMEDCGRHIERFERAEAQRDALLAVAEAADAYSAGTGEYRAIINAIRAARTAGALASGAPAPTGGTDA